MARVSRRLKIAGILGLVLPLFFTAAKADRAVIWASSLSIIRGEHLMMVIRSKPLKLNPLIIWPMWVFVLLADFVDCLGILDI